MKFPLALFALLAFSASAVADAPTPESVASLLAAIHAERVDDVLFKNIEGTMRNSISQALQGQTGKEANKKIVDSFMQRVDVIMKDELSWESMKPLYIRAYSEIFFSQDEIDGLIKFYGSEIGQSYVNKLPIVTERTIAISQHRIQAMVLRMQAILQQAVSESRTGTRYDETTGRFN